MNNSKLQEVRGGKINVGCQYNEACQNEFKMEYTGFQIIL